MDPGNYKKTSFRPNINLLIALALISTAALTSMGIYLQSLIWGLSGVAIDLQCVLVFLAVCTGGVVLHELLHAAAMVLLIKVKFSDIKFGFKAKYLSPYTYCSRIMPVKPLKDGLLFPTIITGLVPLISGILVNNFMITVAGSILTAGGTADAVVFTYLARLPGNALVHDNPDIVGCDVFVPE